MNNKIIVLFMAFALVFTLNIFSDNSHASLSPIYKWPITITNNQNISTPNPFQQAIELNIQSLNQQLAASNVKANIVYTGQYFIVAQGSGTFANFEFTYANGQVIPAWIEGNNSGTLLIWLKLSSIGPHDSIMIYLDIFSSSENLLSASGIFGIGEEPLASPIYAEYDDGASVFDFYDNFAGESLNGNNWVYGGSGAIIVNNTIELKTNNYIYIMTREGFNPSETICDVYSTQQTTNANEVVSMTVGNANNSNGYFIGDFSYELFSNGSYSDPKTFTNTGLFGFSNAIVISESWQSDNKEYYIDDYGYPPILRYYNYSFNSYPLPSFVYYGFGIQYQGNGYLNVSWIDVRAFPPNAVMPSVYFNPILNVSVSYPSENSNSTTNYTIINPQYNATSENLQFNSQYFSFIIDPLFIFSLLIILSLIFIVFMAIAIVKKRR